MKKNASKLKRFGVKAMYYNNNNELFINTLFDKDGHFDNKNQHIVKAEYDDIDTLLKYKNGDFNKYKHPIFEDINNKNGFKIVNNVKLNNKESKKNNFVIVNKVKKTSYIQKVMDISVENNIEIQIYNNLEDIRRIIAVYVNHVIYAINSVSNDFSEDNIILNDYNFDSIGNLPSGVKFPNYHNDKVDINKILFRMNKALKERFNIDCSKFDFVEIVNYVCKYNCNLADNTINSIDNYKKENPNFENQIKNIYTKKYSEIELTISELVDSKNKNYNNYKNNINKFNDVLKKEEPLINLLAYFSKNNVCADREKVYDYLRILSSMRQFAVHNQSPNIDNDNELLENAQEKVDNFCKRFSKNNSKYIQIIKKFNKYKHNYYKDNDIKNLINEFFNFMIFDDGKNKPVSIEKIVKNIMKIDENSCGRYKIIENASSCNRAKELAQEFLIKYKLMLKFYLNHYYNIYLACYEQELRQINSEAKDSFYEDKAHEILKKCSNDFIIISKSVEQYLGKYKNKDDENLYEFKPIKINKNFYKYIYAFSKLLTIKESNDLFSSIISKLESIVELIQLSDDKTISINNNSEIINGIKTLYESNSSLIDGINELKILKSIRIKEKVEKGDCKEYNRIVKIFRGDTSKLQENLNESCDDEKQPKNNNNNNKKQYPLKQFLRNDIYCSKQYQYLSSYCNLSICTEITRNKQLVKFVLENMYNSDDSQIRYLRRIFCDFHYNENIDKDDNEILNDLVNELTNIEYESIYNTIFNKNDLNYKVLAQLYLNVCYLVVKNLVNVNTLYFLEIQEYEKIYNKIKNKRANFDLTIIDDYLKNNVNSKSKSITQLRKLKDKYESDFNEFKNAELIDDKKNLIQSYRNLVEHLAGISSKAALKAFDQINSSNYKITSYFALYNGLIQRILKNKLCNTDIINKYFNTNDKLYSQKLINILNLPFAYNISRYNNATIEKYYVKRFKDESIKVNDNIKKDENK